MLPFLTHKKQGSSVSIISTRKPDAPSEKAPEDAEGLDIAMEDFCNAHEKKDYKAMAAAFKAAFQMLESAPHDEAEHPETEQE